MRRPSIGWSSTVLALGLASAGCGDDVRNTAPVDTPSGSASATVGSAGTGDASSTTGDDTGTSSSTGTTGSDPDTGTSGDDGGEICVAPSDCGLLGQCIDGQCVCSSGHLFDARVGECVVDESCVELTLLEDGCRQRVDGFPAAAMFFGVDFCSGDAVVPARLETLGLELRVLENGVDIESNVESSAVILAKDVESYVVIAVDVSSSVAQSQDLPLLFTEVRGLVAGLAPQPGEPPVLVSIVLFGRTVRTYVEFTDDLAEVDARLEELVVQLQAGQNPINPMGTSLFDAVRAGLLSLDRVRSLRRAVTGGGRLTTGTLVVITDGNDTSGASKEVPASTNQVVSIGVSEDVDFGELDDIGRHGSFYAPHPTDWPGAFAAITKRVDEYPERSYLVGYCSSATQGTPAVEVTLVKRNEPGFTPKKTATCSFDANKFAPNPPLCDAVELANECDTLSCAGLTACGACADDACCNELTGSCQAPESVSPCGGADALCGPTDQICQADTCVSAAGVGAACEPLCQPGVAWCVEDACVATLAEGEPCPSGDACATRRCGPNPENPFGPTVCLAPLALFDSCQGSGTCPAGTYCEGTCKVRKGIGEPCNAPQECLSASCGVNPAFGNQSVCLSIDVCQVSWSHVQ